jgi:hypothetical protein
MSEAGFEKLWAEYRYPFRQFDDLTLARWLSQTLGQLEGRIWRGSHPLVSSARIAAEEGHERQIWLKRLASPPAAFDLAECCRAPLLPFFTRDVVSNGLMCFHCGETAVPFDDLPYPLQLEIKQWSEEYAEIHAVAHWDDKQRREAGNYDSALERAAEQAEKFLAQAASTILPKLLESYPAISWEDQDECLEVRPDDIILE